MTNAKLMMNFALLILLATAEFVHTEVEVSRLKWNGVGFYIVVDAATVQARLDTYAQASPGAPRLYVPATPVFPHLDDGQHVIYIDFGDAKTVDLSEEFAISPTVPSFYVVIPFLSNTVCGPPHYDLSLAQLYQQNDNDQALPIANILYPFRNVEELTISESSVLLRDQGEEIKIEFSVTMPCIEPTSIVREEIDDLVLGNWFFGSHSPGLDFCASTTCTSIPDAVPFCALMDRFRPDIESALPNVCTKYASADEHACAVSFLEVTNITEGFRDFMLLGDGPITVFGAEKFVGNYTTSLWYPCM
ncbi:uncharacterized protein [Apostichopus japonicus]|uniref:uncharacterized protein n=1 Tax=Stichopus japonicus TaxID=307972 RepID=UPI003AB771F7